MHSAVAAMQCGIMKGSFNEALDYSQQRFQGGKEIINWSGLRMLLGQMAVQVKIAEMVVSEAAMAVENQEKQWNSVHQSGGDSPFGARLQADHGRHTMFGRKRLYEGLRPGETVSAMPSMSRLFWDWLR